MRVLLFILIFLSCEGGLAVNPSLILQDRQGSATLESNRFQVRPVPPLKTPKVKKRKPAAIVEPAVHRPVEPPVLLAPVKPQDPVWTVFEIGVATGYLLNDSQADTYARSYSSHSPVALVQGSLWLRSWFGASFQSTQSLNASVKDQFGEASPVTHRWLQGGLRLRRFFGLSSLAAGLDVRRYDGFFAGSSRPNLRTSGVVLLLEGRLPASGPYAWDFDFSLAPQNQHAEATPTSGLRPRSDTFGFGVGGRFQFSGSVQMFWKLSHSVERVVFSGRAQRMDPTTGETSAGVDVTHSNALFTLGCQWGR